MTESQLKELKTLVGEGGVSTDKDDLINYGQDWTRYFEPNAAAVLFPRNTEQVKAIVDYARKSRLSIVPSGGRTGLSSGAVATNNELVVSMEKMNQILNFDPVDQVITCQAGVITQTIQEYAADKGFYFPVDFASKGSSHIGGNIATNAGGVKVLRYGLTRNWVSGLRVVTGQGEILELNKSIIKNAAGYDLMQLFIGSEGTLGLITEASIRFTSPPAPLQVMLFAVPDLESIMKIYAKARTSLSLTAFEMFSEIALKHVLEMGHSSRPIATESPYYVLVEGELLAESSLESFMKLFEESVESGWVLDGVLSQTETQFKEIWSLRENIAESLAKFKPYKNDISVRLSRVPEFVTEVDALLSREYPEFEVVWFGHIGDGNLHISILKPDSWSKEKFYQECRKVDVSLYSTIKKFEGSISAEHGVGLAKKAFLSYTRSPEEIQYMRLIKNLFDPDGILNPGKIF